MSARNLWIAKDMQGHTLYVLVPLDGFITQDNYELRQQQGTVVYKVDATYADLSEILGQCRGDGAELFKHLEDAGKLREMREEDVPY